MPPAEHNREVRIPLFDCSRNLDSFADHWAGDQRDSQAEGIFNFFENALLVVGSDRSINDADVVSGIKQRRRDGENPERGCCFNAGERGNKEHDFLRRFHLIAFRSFNVRRTAVECYNALDWLPRDDKLSTAQLRDVSELLKLCKNRLRREIARESRV